MLVVDGFDEVIEVVGSALTNGPEELVASASATTCEVEPLSDGSVNTP